MTRAVTTATVRATPCAIGDYRDACHGAINRAHEGLVMSMLDCATVARIAAQRQSAWQRLAVAEQTRRVRLEA